MAFCKQLAQKHLNHAVDEGVDVVLAVTVVTTLDEVGELVLPAASGGVELEGPQEVGGGLEVGADGEDLVDQILHTDQTLAAEHLLDQRVVRQSNALAVDLGEAALVDQLLDRLQVGVPAKEWGERTGETNLDQVQRRRKKREEEKRAGTKS
jgi:hypothetical protein